MFDSKRMAELRQKTDAMNEAADQLERQIQELRATAAHLRRMAANTIPTDEIREAVESAFEMAGYPKSTEPVTDSLGDVFPDLMTRFGDEVRAEAERQLADPRTDQARECAIDEAAEELVDRLADRTYFHRLEEEAIWIDLGLWNQHGKAISEEVWDRLPV